MRLPSLALAASLVTLASTAQAQTQALVGDLDAGRTIAKTWCANCHVVDPNATQGADQVPTFAAIAKMTSTTAMSLHAFLQTPHSRMPNFQLGNQQIDDVSAYILSLKK